jgi:lipoate synthase
MFLGGSRIAQKAIEKLGDQYRIKVIEENIEKVRTGSRKIRKCPRYQRRLQEP